MKISKREKIILSLAALAGIYAGGIFLLSGSNDKSAPPETDMALTHEFVVEVAQSLAQNSLTEAEQAILEKTQTPWPANPFVEESISSSTDPAMAAATMMAPASNTNPDQFSFTGYIRAGTLSLAIINGDEYAPGDRVTGTSFTVRSISQHRVLLADADNNILTIPMMENSDSDADWDPGSQQSE